MGRAEVILLDTHVLVWLDLDSDALGSIANRLVDAAWRDRTLMVSAISFWECALLHRRERLELPKPPSVWREDLIAAGLNEVPLDGGTSIAAAQLDSLHKDPVDRFIVATALAHDATLLTADKSILRWRGKLKRQDARK
jgi:PIN domain nuclease of toxin-antitoxin system